MHAQFMLAQAGGFDPFSILIWIVFLLFFYPLSQYMMVKQILLKLDQVHSMVEGMSLTAKRHIIRKINRNVSKEVKDSLHAFMEFFAIEPVSLDPYGIVKKIEHIGNLEEKRFRHFVGEIAPHLNEEEKANMVMGLSGAVTLHQVAKIIKHYYELIKKTKNLQMAMIIQMQIPLIERLVKALAKGTEAMTNGWPIGDTIGPLIAAELIGNGKTQLMYDETTICRKKLKGRDVIVMKARGPGGRLGKLGRSVEDILKREKIAKVVTIDAAAKLEGEKTGTIAEGVGVAIGGAGVDRNYIENLSVQHDISLDTVIVKMGNEEAIMPMRPEVLGAATRVMSLVEKRIAETKARGKIIVIGVGNSCGVGDSGKAAEEAKAMIKKNIVMLKKRGDFSEKESSGISSWLGF